MVVGVVETPKNGGMKTLITHHPPVPPQIVLALGRVLVQVVGWARSCSASTEQDRQPLLLDGGRVLFLR